MSEIVLIWLTCFLSLFHKNFSVSYRASRTIYTQTSAAPLCSDYITTTFDFEDTSNEVTITIYSSQNTTWFGIGLPDPLLYFDKTVRKNTLMNGYAIIYINSAVNEYNMVSTANNIIDSITLQGAQNIVVDPVVIGASDVTITLRRNLTTTDPTDFVFDLENHKNCHPILLSVAIGDQSTFDGSNSYGSSYTYIYDISLLANTSTYVQTWYEPELGRSDIPFTQNRPFSVTFLMNPSTEIVKLRVEDGPKDVSTSIRAWALSFPDLADVVYYSPGNPDPINMESDYAVMWGDTSEVFTGPTCRSGTPSITEARLPIDGTACDTALDLPTNEYKHRMCWDELPNPQNIFYNRTLVANVQTYWLDLKFKSCGYEFNPYEFKTCRPFTIVSMAVTAHNHRCFSDVATDPGLPSAPQIHHLTNKIQIDGFPTRAPTFSPSQAPSIAPSTPPSVSPSDAPTYSPVNPTRSPTFPTNAPSESPTTPPTARPTDLPTVNSTVFDYPACRGLRVKHLNVLFPAKQAMEHFNEMDGIIYNRRRSWSNGRLQIHFTNRFEDAGDWVITNGSYSAISIEDANYNNPDVYNITLLDESPNSLPGPYPDGYIYYDHFPHDNILQAPDQQVTLYFSCDNTSFPTTDPSPGPTTANPSPGPTTTQPTMAPTANCTAFTIISEARTCTDQIAQLFAGSYLKSSDTNNKARWNGVASVTGYTITYNPWHQQWIIDGVHGYSALDTSETEYHTRYPPNYIFWSVFDQENPFAQPCTIRISYQCSWSGIPTEAPTRSPTTAYPTSATPTSPPTSAPSNAPSVAPSYSPSQSPTAAPSATPIKDCLGFYVNNTNDLDGMYARSNVIDTDTNRYYWDKLKGDGEIFWSNSPLHESWLINSDSAQKYWLSVSKPYYQPSLIGEWILYFGASPFRKDRRTLELECFNTLPPTADPTVSPSLTPSNAPSSHPSISPTTPPTYSPSDAPSQSPTGKPTTLAPTYDPTVEPTHYPTDDPTAEPCQFLIINNPEAEAALDPYVGVYLHNNNTNPNSWVRKVQVDANIYDFRLVHDGTSTWTISNNIPNDNYILQVPGNVKRAPYFATNWRLNTLLPKNYTLYLECSQTDAPTNAPTIAPSLAPSQAPTSSCRGLYFNNTNDVNFTYNGWYARQDAFEINDHKWWISVHQLATIAYLDGYWYLSEKDNDLIDDEDPIMVNIYGGHLLSPPSGPWIYAHEHNNGVHGGTAEIIITCQHTAYPTQKPTNKPSSTPTQYIAQTWQFCPDFRPHFTFISQNTSAVYWPQPILNAHNYAVNISSSPIDMRSGTDITTPGQYDITYTAVDNSPSATSIECMVTVYVIGGSLYDTSYEYCKRQRFLIEIQFNDTYYRLATDQEAKESKNSDNTNNNPILSGIVYDPNLQTDGQNCYVIAQQVANYGTVEVENKPGKSTFLGMEAVNLVWEIFVLLLIIILFALIADCLYRLYKERKEKQNANDEQTEQLLASQQLSRDPNEPNPNDEEQKGNQAKDSAADIEMQEAQNDN